MRASASSETLEHVEVVVVEVVVGEAGAQRVGALLGELVVDVGEPLGEVVVGVRRTRRRGRSWRLLRSRGRVACASSSIQPVRLRVSDDLDHGVDGLVEVELGRVDGGHAFCGVHEVDDLRVGASRGCSCSPRRRPSRPTSSAERLAILASSDAVSRMRTGASGATTVVMSRPSTTMPGRRIGGDDRAEQLDEVRAHLGNAGDARSRPPRPAARGWRRSRRSRPRARRTRRGRCRSRSRSREAARRRHAASSVSMPRSSACQASAR